jgi:hypothetical protein
MIIIKIIINTCLYNLIVSAVAFLITFFALVLEFFISITTNCDLLNINQFLLTFLESIVKKIK